MKTRLLTVILASTLSNVAALAYHGAYAVNGDDFSLGAGFDYSSGNYGLAADTSMLIIPVQGMYRTGPWTFKLTVPYIQITGPGGVLPNGLRSKSTRTTTAGSTTHSGLGDVSASTTYNIAAGSESSPRVDLTGKIKFGTADTYLGTGQNDYAAQVDLYQQLGRFTPMGSLGYEILGSPAGLALNNVTYGTVGGDYRFTDETHTGIQYFLSQRIAASIPEQKELTVYMNHSIDDNLNIRGYVLKGFSDASPDSGFGLMLYSYF
ncbi:hypothetical protein GALL_92280 [mine drainage metagenome]|uniref:Uncharacterized protein n=1 Tax=mine drainage metagenome TaxID=410659 RepID=A0A1J5SJ30_9ZZZZ